MKGGSQKERGLSRADWSRDGGIRRVTGCGLVVRYCGESVPSAGRGPLSSSSALLEGPVHLEAPGSHPQQTT